MAETPLMRRILLAMSKAGARCFRNNIGVAVYPDGSRVRYGLCPGSSDLIGWQSVEVTPAMVGKRVAVFVAVEVKTDRRGSKATEGQGDFLAAVQAAGGIAGVARSEVEALALIRG